MPAPNVFYCYVDNCFCVLHKDDVTRFLLCLNSAESSAQFTVEKEENCCLPFLDVLVRRTGNGLAFSVYRKATHTGQHLNFASCHPIGHKTPVYSSLATCAKCICTGEEQLKRGLKVTQQELSQNGYPRNFTKKTEQ